MSWLTKWITVPRSNDTTKVASVQLWYVRWTSRYGPWHGDTQDHMEAFTTAEAANTFATSLRNAFTLLKHSGAGTSVSVEKAR